MHTVRDKDVAIAVHGHTGHGGSGAGVDQIICALGASGIFSDLLGHRIHGVEVVGRINGDAGYGYGELCLQVGSGIRSVCLQRQRIQVVRLVSRIWPVIHYIEFARRINCNPGRRTPAAGWP